MEITRGRTGNQTAFARQQAFTALIPLPSGLVSDSNQPPMRAVGALNGTDQGVHYVRQGPKAADGSWRMARVQFSADTPAGVVGARGYGHWSEREIPIELGVGAPLPNDTPHPSVVLSALRFEFETQMQGIAHEDASTPFEFGAPGPVRTWRVDPLQSTWRELRSPWAQQTQPRQELPDTAGAGGRHLRAYRVTARLLPEGEDGAGGGPQDVSEPSLWASLIYEVPSGDLDGWGRAIRYWLQVGTSLASSNADARAPDFPMGRFVNPPKCRIYSADPVNHPVDVVVAGDRAFLPEPLRQVPGGVEFDLTKWDPGVGTANPDEDLRGYDNLHDGMSRVYQGVVYFRGGTLTASETNTRAAILSGLTPDAPGHDCVQYAIPHNLKDYRTYGAFGRVLDPAEDGWDIEGLRDQTAQQARSFYDFYTVDDARDPWQDCHLGTGAYTNAGAAQRGFGASTFMAWAMSGHPDVRALWLAASQEAHRWHHYRKLDGSHWRWDELRDPATPASYDSSCVFGDGRSWFSSNFNTRWPNLSAHQPWSLLLGKWGDIKVSKRVVNGFDISTPRGSAGNGWKGYDFQHFVQNAWASFAHLTGDRWCLDSELVDQINLTVCSRQTFPNQDEGDFAWSTQGVGVPRAEGRWQRAFAHVHNLATRDEDVEVGFKRYAERSAWLKYIGTNTSPNPPNVFGDWDQDLLSDLPEITKDNPRYFANGQKRDGTYPFQECGTPDPAWPDINPNSWSVWHIGILCQAHYGWYLMAALDSNVARGQQARADLAFMLQKMTRGGILNGFELIGGSEWRGYYAVPNDGRVGVRGAAPPQSTWDVQFTPSVCASGATNPTTIFFGPKQNATEGHPWFYRSGPNLGTKWPVGIPVLAHIFNPDDAEVAARQFDLMVTRPIYPDAATRRATLFTDNEPWQDFWAIIDSPFTWPKAATAPTVGEESGEGLVIVSGDSAEQLVADESGTASVVIAGDSAEEAIQPALVNESGEASVSVKGVGKEEAIAGAVVNEDAIAAFVTVVTDSADQSVGEEAGEAMVFATAGAVELAENNPQAASASNATPTLQQLLGPDLKRSRHARIIETGKGFKRLIAGRDTGGGRPPRQSDQNPYGPHGR